MQTQRKDFEEYKGRYGRKPLAEWEKIPPAEESPAGGSKAG